MKVQTSTDKDTGPGPRVRYRRLTILAWVIMAQNIALLIAGLIASITTAIPGTVADLRLLAILITTSILATSGTVAMLILTRYPHHMVGWLLLFLCLSETLTYFTESFVALVEYSSINTDNLFVALISWLAQWVWFPLVIIPIILIPLYFPDGRLLSRRWRFAAICGSLALITGIVSFAIHPEASNIEVSLTSESTNIMERTTLAGLLIQYVFAPLYFISVAAAVGSLILRYRRSTSVQRAQLKWVLYTLVLGVAMVLGSAAILPQVMDASPTEIGHVQNILIVIFIITIPVVIGIAILRYRLYDIDLIIRRTLVYGVVTATLVAIYFGSVVLLQGLFTELTGQRSPVAIVISTLIIAALFNPLRRQVQDFIDRRFYRTKYDAQQTLARFGQTARDETDLEELTAELLSVVNETMQPEKVTLWLKKSKK